MKFGKHIRRQAVPEWKDDYLCYKELKRLIKVCVCARLCACAPCLNEGTGCRRLAGSARIICVVRASRSRSKVAA